MRINSTYPGRADLGNSDLRQLCCTFKRRKLSQHMGCQHKVWLQDFRISFSISLTDRDQRGAICVPLTLAKRREMSVGPCRLSNSGFSEVDFLKTYPGRAEPGNIEFPTGVRVTPALCPTLAITTVL